MKHGTYNRTMEANGKTRNDTGTCVFEKIKNAGTDARVSVNMGYGFDYGVGKCSVTVSLVCAQTVSAVEDATYAAMMKANELAIEGMDIIDKHLRGEE